MSSVFATDPEGVQVAFGEAPATSEVESYLSGTLGEEIATAWRRWRRSKERHLPHEPEFTSLLRPRFLAAEREYYRSAQSQEDEARRGLESLCNANGCTVEEVEKSAFELFARMVVERKAREAAEIAG